MVPKITFYILFVFSFLEMFLLLGNRDDGIYSEYLFLLPFSFCIFLLILWNAFDKVVKSTATLVVLLLYFLRYAITPFFMYLGEYQCFFSHINTENVYRAVGLSVVEIVLLGVVVLLTLKRIEKTDCYDFFSKETYMVAGKSSFVFSAFSILMVVFLVLVYFLEPSVQKLYVSLFSFDGSLVTGNIMDLAVSSGDKKIMTLFTFVFDFARIVLPIYVFILFKQFVKIPFVAIVLSFLIVLSQFAFLSATSALAIFCVIVDIVVLSKMYSAQKKYILGTLYFIAFVSVLILFSLKMINTVLYSSSNDFILLSKMFQAYFSGISNIAATFNIPDDNVWDYLFYDLYYTIPFNGSLFGLSGQTSAQAFNAYNYGKYQIIPCIGQASLYLGTFLSPIVPLSMIYMGIRVYHNAEREPNLWLFASKTLCWLYLCLSPIIYNGQIFMARFMNTILPCILFALTSRTLLKRHTYGKN